MKTRRKIYQIITSILLAILVSLSNITPATVEAIYPYNFLGMVATGTFFIVGC